MPDPIRTTVPRRKSDMVLTREQVQRWALGVLVGVFCAGLVAAWKVSAQVSEVKHDIAQAKAEAEALSPIVNHLTLEVTLLRKGQDSLITLMTERERRVR